jgi:type IV pilus assembly protein PilA
MVILIDHKKEKFMKLFKNFKGFTLVELMVVVAIIGILAAVAVPNFRKYQAKSKTSEAKLILASAFMAETGAFSDYTSYVTCLERVGFTPESSVGRYYTVGFQTVNNGTSGYGNSFVSINYLNTCLDAAEVGYFIAGKTVPPNASSCTVRACMPASDTSATTFTVGAGGYIVPGYTTDQWNIDHTKSVRQITVGY